MKVFVQLALLDKIFKKRYTALVVAVAVIGFVFWIDYVTVERYSFYLFYFPSIVLAAWYCGKWSSAWIVLLCGVTWYLARLNLQNPSGPSVLIWNASIRVLSFIFVAWVTIYLKTKQNQLIVVQKRLEGLLELEKNLSRHDPLTGAFNSRAFHEKLTEERMRSQRHGRVFSLLYIDLDHFKEVNDSHGHLFGDDILKKFVLSVKGIVRETDHIARLGGDEFVMLLPETDLERAKKCAKKILETVKKDLSALITASIGVVAFSQIPRFNETMIQAADKAMYQAKQMGEDKICATLYRD